jgi:hypothetical protein
MTDRPPPTLPPLPADEAIPAGPTPQSNVQARTRSRRPVRVEPASRQWAAGHALVVTVVALALASFLNAPGIHKSAYNQTEGWQRDVAVALTGLLADVSHALFLDRPRQLVKEAIGRGDDDEIDTEVALPKTKPLPPPKPRKLAFTPSRKLRLWVAGDSLVITPGLSVAKAAAESPVIASVGAVEGRVATGLARPDAFNWFKEIQSKMKELKPGAVVLAFGANDDKAYMTGLPEGTSIGEFGDASWQREYGRRVAGVMDTVIRAGGIVVWIGLPQTRSAEQTRRFDVINAVVQGEARKRKGRAVFIDTYRLFAGDDGGYSDYLEDVSGRQQQVRAGDGVHFERAGGDIIARAVLKSLNEAYDLTSWRRTKKA